MSAIAAQVIQARACHRIEVEAADRVGPEIVLHGARYIVPAERGPVPYRRRCVIGDNISWPANQVPVIESARRIPARRRRQFAGIGIHDRIGQQVTVPAVRVELRQVDH